MLLYLLLYFTVIFQQEVMVDGYLSFRDHHEHCSYCEGYCGMCTQGYYGEHCNMRCQSTCHKDSRCHRYSGRCETTDNSIGVDNTISWTYNCELCHGNCSFCFPGWYGIRCTHRCDNCGTDGCNKTTGICDVCAEGYHGTKCKRECPTNCDLNCERNTSKCIGGCKPGWWGHYCSKNCSFGCLERVCTFDGNNCFLGCIDGYAGRLCKRKCRNGSKNNCLRCPRNLYGENCTKRCSVGCVDDICGSDGSCTCRNGYTGHDCSSKLHKTKRCTDGRYGDTCNKICTIHCIKQLCKDDGTCLAGCTAGRYGDTCNKTCNIHCNKQLCRHDGTCLKGCLSGWHGTRCSQLLQPSLINTATATITMKNLEESENGEIYEIEAKKNEFVELRKEKMKDYLTRTEFLLASVALIVVIACSVLVYCVYRIKWTRLTNAESQSLTSGTSSDHYDVIDDTLLNISLSSQHPHHNLEQTDNEDNRNLIRPDLNYNQRSLSSGYLHPV